MSTLHHLPAPAAFRGKEQGSSGRFLQPVRLHRYADGFMERVADLVAVEEPLLLRVRGRENFTFVRTPGDDHNLVAGHLFAQGLIRTHADIGSLSFPVCGESDMVEVELVPGKNVRYMGGGMKAGHTMSAEALFKLKDRFEKRQALFHSTRATHAAALFSREGRMVAFGEDVGRHNAFDKALGQALSSGCMKDVAVGMLSSRLALELAEKASMAGIGILCGFSVATSSALEFSQTRNITLVGRLRETSMNIYTNHWRITP